MGWWLREAYNDGDVENHVRHIGRLVDPERDNKLPQGRAEGVRQAHDSRGGHPATVREPQVGISRRGAQHERLGQPRQDLAEHDHAKDAAVARVGTCIADPVSDEDQHGGADDGRPGSEVEDVDDDGGDEDKGEEEGRAEPVDGRRIGVEVGGRV